MNCQSQRCRNPATWHRPNAIHGCANALCDACMIRIYNGDPHHKQAWEKISAPSPQPTPPKPATAAQPTLF